MNARLTVATMIMTECNRLTQENRGHELSLCKSYENQPPCWQRQIANDFDTIKLL